MNDIPKLKDILGLSAEERLALASAIWDSLAAEPKAVPVPNGHREIIEQRLFVDEADPSAGESFAEERQRIERGNQLLFAPTRKAAAKSRRTSPAPRKAFPLS